MARTAAPSSFDWRKALRGSSVQEWNKNQDIGQKEACRTIVGSEQVSHQMYGE